MDKPMVLPYLKWVNGWQLVVMGESLTITREQAHRMFAQLQRWEVRHG